MAIQKPKIYRAKPKQFVDDYTTYNEAARDTKRNVTLNKPKDALKRAASPSPSRIIVATKKNSERKTQRTQKSPASAKAQYAQALYNVSKKMSDAEKKKAYQQATASRRKKR